jgi:hypothetical protein
MTTNPDPDPRHDHDPVQSTERDRSTDDARHPVHEPDASTTRSHPSKDVRQLSDAEERDLHFNGYPAHGMRPLHELCPVGGCQYKTLDQNLADLDEALRQDREPDQADPEAEL